MQPSGENDAPGRPSTAREALIVEALGDVARLLERVETLTSSLETGRQALSRANEQFVARLQAFDAVMIAITARAQKITVEHLVRRSNEVIRQSVDEQRRSMSEAARLAFAEQVEPALARLSKSMQQRDSQRGPPWERWLAHAATACVSAATTWVVASLLAFR